MGIGDAPIPVDDSTPVNNPVPVTGDDALRDATQKAQQAALSGNSELAYAVRWLYDFLGQTYPPP